MSSDLEKKEPRRRKTCSAAGGMPGCVEGLLQAVLVGLDHFLDHLAADGAGLLAGQFAVVALLEVDADLPWRS